MSSLLGPYVSPYESPGLPFGVLWLPMTPQQHHGLPFGVLWVSIWVSGAPFWGPMGPRVSLLGSYGSHCPPISDMSSLLGSCVSPYGSPGLPFGVLWHPVTPQQRHELTFGSLCVPLWFPRAPFWGPMSPNDPTAAPWAPFWGPVGFHMGLWGSLLGSYGSQGLTFGVLCLPMTQ